MNKKIKIIELLNKIANGEYPKKIKYDNQIYEYKNIIQGTGYVTENYDWFNSDMFVDSKEDLNSYVEILEDNTEEIEELKRTQNVYDMTLECYHDIEKKISNDELADKINEIIRYIKRKEKNE